MSKAVVAESTPVPVRQLKPVASFAMSVLKPIRYVAFKFLPGEMTYADGEAFDRARMSAPSERVQKMRRSWHGPHPLKYPQPGLTSHERTRNCSLDQKEHAMKVNNVNGTSDNTCKCGSWLEHWKNLASHTSVVLCRKELR